MNNSLENSSQAERHQRVMQVLADAMEAGTGQRVTVIAESCANDNELKSQVEKLLRHEKEALNFLEETLFDGEAQEDASLIGTQVGCYRIVERLGRGGMGAVYLAERSDDEYKKDVAIKFIKHSLPLDVVQKQFRTERQILANLDHQNIARLIDGGRTDHGPYLVMEYVDGEAIDIYAASLRLSTIERLQLFLKVCEAVEYAHRKQVIHRDIKPGNILVNSEGEPKLLDFGIAKLVGRAPSPSKDPTMTWRVMTPEYASPEQILGEPITTSSDIYSLGAVLYKLLTGRSPYRLRGRDVSQLKELICTRTPERPSTIISDKRDSLSSADSSETITANSVAKDNGRALLRRTLRGDLDNITLMALRKEPERRYTSVSQFAEDIRRYLNGLPILARKDAPTYLLAKFLKRRRRFLLALACVGLLGLFIGIAVAQFSLRKKSGSVSNLEGPSASREARLVAWWPGNDSLIDASGNGNNGSPTNGVTFAPGKVNDAFKFSAMDQSVSLGKPTSLQLQELTIEAWVKYEIHPDESPDFSKADEFPGHTIFHYGLGGYNFVIFGYDLPGGNVGGGIQHIHGLCFGREGVSHVHSGELIVPPDGKFHHVAVSKSGTTVTFYVDGVASAPVTLTDPFTFDDGARFGQNFVGLIDELKIFDRGLSKSEILASYFKRQAR